MYLKELIEFLEQQDPSITVPMGFSSPHSYRGSYDCLAFEPTENVKVKDILKDAKDALGSVYNGWKGGKFLMDKYTHVYLARWGETGEEIGIVLLSFMVGKYGDIK